MPERAHKPEELPPPSAELVLWRVSVEAYLACAGKKRSERFLQLMAEKLANEENLSQVFQIRPTEDAIRVRRARREAVAMFERYLPIFLARLPRD
jgi:hypothetical protein